MSVLTYLQTRASNAVLSNDERTSISTSISTLSSRLTSYFPTSLSSHFLFGSYPRGTILPRSMDERSDVDYMVVFSDGGYKPQTYLDRLRRFVEARYSTSEITQSSPTIVLELNHIRFELVPALAALFYGFSIPDGPDNWQSTNPSDFSGKLTTANDAANYLLKPTIRLAKYWNACNGYVFGSYLFEKWIVERSFWGCNNQRDYLFAVFDALSTATIETAWRKERVERAKKIVADVRNYESASMPVTAELEVKKLIPAG